MDFNKYSDLIRVIINELDKMDYNELNRTFGSMTIDEIKSLRYEIYRADICEYFNITPEEFENNSGDYIADYEVSKAEERAFELEN